MLFDDVLAAGPVRALVSDTAWLQAMLDAEAALAGAQADVGLVPADAAERDRRGLRGVPVRPRGPGPRGGRRGEPGRPAGPRGHRRGRRDAGRYVHMGATSQDIVDTAAMLVARSARRALLADLDACTAALAELAAEHRSTVHVGRTLLQQALPTTFGLTAAGWLTRCRRRARAAVGGAARPARRGRRHARVARYGRSRGRRGVRAAARARRAALPWHTDRGVVAELAGALGRVCGSVAKIAGDVVLLAQTEVGEVRERAEGAAGRRPCRTSGTRSRRSPRGRAAAQAPGLVSTLFAAMAHEHQRAAGRVARGVAAAAGAAGGHGFGGVVAAGEPVPAVRATPRACGPTWT